MSDARPPRRGFQAPAEVTGYFDRKGDRPGFSWLDVWGEEHAYAFTVAKAVDAELRGTLRAAVSRGISESRTFENFLKDLQPELARIGWWGPRVVADPTGMDPDALVDFSSRRRLETIYWSNMRAARAAGQWQRIQRTKAVLPFVVYVRSSAADPRPEHLGWVGVILPADDPWWDSHFPPNGWGCLCSVRQIGARERDRLLTAERKPDGIWYVTEPPADGPPRTFRNRRTGEVTQIPAGIDPGWHTNPGLGRARTLIDALSAKLETADPADALPIVDALWEDPIVRIVPTLPEKTWLPAGVSPRLQDELDARSPIVSIAGDAIQDRIRRHGSKIEDFAKLPAILSDARIFPDLTPSKRAGARDLFARFGRSWWKAVVVRSSTGLLRVLSFSQRDARRVADQILDQGFGRAELLSTGFSAEEADAAIEGWRMRRGGKEEPPRL